MKLGTNLKHGQKICREQELKLHPNFNRIMPFEVFSLKIVSTLSFFKTIKDVDLRSTSRKPFKMYCHESFINTQHHQMMCRKKEL